MTTQRWCAAIALLGYLLIVPALITGRVQAQSNVDPRGLGDPNAPLVIIEYSDYECPACASFVRDTKPQLIAEYVETGKVYYLYRDNPLPHHLAGRIAAAYARCAAQQGQFWPMHQRLFQGYIDGEWGGNPSASERVFLQYSEELGLDPSALQTCVRDPATDRAIAADIEEARNRGLRGTPAYILRWPGGPERGDVLTGAQSFGTWRYLLDERLNAQPGSTIGTSAGGDLASVFLYLALGAAGGLAVLVAGGSVLWWLARRHRSPRV
ncbi:MAG: DsbA family protein [Roseiflexus sp.]|nr:DsbA family protein [Roseiflexus sp.]MCS7288439.1 DsbA family protein [Roseiflexus sp.]MDW8144824.1 thioredoxin domain-containing protein [Roseiflexaceae bacterium]MDW8232267.1 thioredoxin domain-containing protein [Roseiflexaceae bacterium]